MDIGVWSRHLAAAASTKTKKKAPAAKAAAAPKKAPRKEIKSDAFPSSSPVSKKTAPKRPPTAYSLFMRAEYANLKKSNPDIKLPDASRRIASLWKQTPQVDRVRYMNESARLMVAYGKNRPQKEKKPLTAYSMYTKEMFAPVKARYPNDPFAEIVKRISEMWRRMPPEEKKLRETKAGMARKSHQEKTKGKAARA